MFGCKEYDHSDFGVDHLRQIIMLQCDKCNSRVQSEGMPEKIAPEVVIVGLKQD